jgi:hypothetical protein
VVNGQWTEAYQMTSENYRRFSTAVNFKTDFAFLTNSDETLHPGFGVSGFWDNISIVREDKDRAGQGVSIRMHLEHKKWLVSGTRFWFNSD